MAERKPDFGRFRKVLLREGEPDLLPFYDLFADAPVLKAVTGKPPGLEARIDFQYKMGYDYVGTGANFGYPLRKTRSTEDVGSALPHESRGFVDDNHGAIECRADFDAYPWPVITDDLTGDIDKCAGMLPFGMKMLLGSSGILENVVWLMGYIPFSYAAQDEEQLIWDMFEKIGGNAVRVMKAMMEQVDLSKVGGVVMGDDMGYSQGTMVSPEMLRKYVFPWQKKVVEIAHEHGLPFIIHSCGNLEGIMDDLIDYVGIDAKHSFEDKIMPVAEAKRRYGKRIAVLGGIDMNFLVKAAAEEVAPYVAKVMEECMPGGGYALGTGNSIANYIPLENYYEMLRVGREKGVY